ncbi:MAG: hypothetical protein ACF8MF_14045 [Phycisphaerales bacterium JB052]
MESRIESYTKTSKLAVLALLLSVPCMISGPLAFIPLLLAIVALVRISKSVEIEGKPLAVIAIMLSLVGIASTKVYIDAAENAKFMQAQTVVRSHAHSLLLYIGDNQDQKPSQDEWPDLLIEQGVLHSPEFQISSREDGDGISYIYRPEFTPWDETSIMLYEDPKHWVQGVIVAYGDAHVDVVPHDEFNRLLAQQTADSP